MRTIALLGLLNEKKYTRLAYHLNHDLDYAISGALRADTYLDNAPLAFRVHKWEGYIKECIIPNLFIKSTNDDIYRIFAKYRIKNPTKSEEPHILEAIDQIIEKYKTDKD